ncbi:MAG: hypothetical protein NVV68_13780 [Dokdonella sp.]|nr:hypothetical protein [Dokdonella sp.]
MSFNQASGVQDQDIMLIAAVSVQQAKQSMMFCPEKNTFPLIS